MINANPKISVCIPTFNRNELLKCTIDSVLKQNFKEFEILICVDGCTDGTIDTLKRYTDKRIKVIINKKNRGYIESMRRLVNESNTEWIQFLSDDDLMHKEYLSNCWKVIQKKPDIGFVVTANNFIDANGKYLHKVTRKRIHKEDYFRNMRDVIVFEKTDMLGNFTMMSIPMRGGKYAVVLPTAFPNHIFNKRLYKKIGGSDPELFYGHDSLVVSSICCLAPCAYIDKPLIDYRIHPNISNKMNATVEGVKQYLLFIDKLVIFCRKNKIEIPYLKGLLLRAFEKDFFSIKGRLLRIASKTPNFNAKNKNITDNLTLVFKTIPQARYSVKNNFIILLAYLLPSNLIHKIGMFYFKHLRR